MNLYRGYEGERLIDSFDALLNATEEEKDARGTRYTPREISQQPASWLETFRIIRERQADLRSFLAMSGFDPGKPADRTVVFLVGAGTSDYIGRALTFLLRQTWQCEVWAVPSTSLLPDLESYLVPERKYLWISFSRSGDSSEGAGALEAALADHPRILHLLVKCNEKGRMAQVCALVPDRAFTVALDDSVNDRGLAMTSSFTNMVIAGQCLAHLNSLSIYEKTLAVISDTGERFLKRINEVAPSIAQEHFSKGCFVGTGESRWC